MKKIYRLAALFSLTGVIWLGTACQSSSEAYGAIVVGTGTAASEEPQSLRVGWINKGEAWQYIGEDGQPIKNGFTPDGYLVDDHGNWGKRSIRLLEDSYLLPDMYRSSSSAGDLTESLGGFQQINRRIHVYIGQLRQFYADEDSVTYYQKSGNEETFLMGLYKEPTTDGWKIKLAVKLADSKNKKVATACDYAVFQMFLAQISHVPEKVGDAIYQSWQKTNSYGLSTDHEVLVGDVYVSYAVEDGAGIYSLRDGRR